MDTNNLTELRLLCHQYIYNDIANVELLKLIITQHIDTLSCDYDQDKKVISIRIKKTSMKKNANFEHNPIYYYNIFDIIFRDYIRSIAPQINIPLRGSGLGPIEETIYKIPSLGTMYNLTCVSDNIIMVYL